jgi:isopentenyl-diphosphate delta-isomerase
LVAAIDPRGSTAVVEELGAMISTLRIAMFCSGCADLAALRQLTLERL